MFFLVVMMNLLISVITDVYAVIKENKVAASTREKIESLLDVYSLLFWDYKKDTKMYIHFFSP